MASARAEWRETAFAAIDEAGLRRGEARRSVVELLAGEGCCLTAQEIRDRLRDRGESVGTASVYRALELLAEIGLVQRLELGEGGTRFEAAIPGGEHHHHVVCEACGRISAFEDEALERAIGRLASRLEHQVSGHDVVIHGRCSSCARRRSPRGSRRGVPPPAGKG